MPPRKRWKGPFSGSKNCVSRPGANLQSSVPELYARAIKLLSNRPFSTSELKKKLLQHTSEESLVRSALDQLISHGYLDDREFIEGYIHSRRRSKHYGRQRIELELRLKGLDSSLVAEMLEQFYPPDEDQLELRRTLEKKLLGLSPPMDAKKLAKLYNYLLRQGFSREAVYREIRRRFKDVDLSE